MKPLCPACNEPMNKQGRGFECEGCRQIIVYFSVSDASPYFAPRIFTDTREPSVRPH
jgi:tRNA(Ile2) C34 agmatinyltransferase TiaS